MVNITARKCLISKNTAEHIVEISLVEKVIDEYKTSMGHPDELHCAKTSYIGAERQVEKTTIFGM